MGNGGSDAPQFLSFSICVLAAPVVVKFREAVPRGVPPAGGGVNGPKRRRRRCASKIRRAFASAAVRGGGGNADSGSVLRIEYGEDDAHKDAPSVLNEVLVFSALG